MQNFSWTHQETGLTGWLTLLRFEERQMLPKRQNASTFLSYGRYYSADQKIQRKLLTNFSRLNTGYWENIEKHLEQQKKLLTDKTSSQTCPSDHKKDQGKQESWESIIHSADFREGNSGHQGRHQDLPHPSSLLFSWNKSQKLLSEGRQILPTLGHWWNPLAAGRREQKIFYSWGRAGIQPGRRCIDGCGRSWGSYLEMVLPENWSLVGTTELVCILSSLHVKGL